MHSTLTSDGMSKRKKREAKLLSKAKIEASDGSLDRLEPAEGYLGSVQEAVNQADETAPLD